MDDITLKNWIERENSEFLRADLANWPSEMSTRLFHRLHTRCNYSTWQEVIADYRVHGGVCWFLFTQKIRSKDATLFERLCKEWLIR